MRSASASKTISSISVQPSQIMNTTIKSKDIPSLIGRQLPPSPWLEITQERVQQFADATNDHQFIHLDPERAANTPFGGTIAHGFLSLSLLTYLNNQSGVLPEDLEMVINYGSDKVRYLAPVRVGKRIRSVQTITDATEKRPGQWLMKIHASVEIDGEQTPALIAETLSMWIVRT